eukprot:2133564-Rhodomonas_salina.1
MPASDANGRAGRTKSCGRACRGSWQSSWGPWTAPLRSATAASRGPSRWSLTAGRAKGGREARGARLRRQRGPGRSLWWSCCRTESWRAQSSGRVAAWSSRVRCSASHRSSLPPLSFFPLALIPFLLPV